MSAIDPNGGGALLVPPAGGASLPTASLPGEIPVSTGPGTTYAAAGASSVRSTLGLGAAALLGAGSATGDVALRSYAEALVGGLAGRALTMRAPVDTVLSLTGLDAGPLATMVYDSGAKTLTAGMNADVTGFGLTVGKSVLFRFQSTGMSTTGVYEVTSTGADDPGGAPAVFTRRSDFDASGDFTTGLALLDVEEGGLYRLTVPGGFVLDTGDVVFTKVEAILAEEGTTSGSMLVYNGSGWVVLPPGTNGQVLTMAAGAPAWV